MRNVLVVVLIVLSLTAAVYVWNQKQQKEHLTHRPQDARQESLTHDGPEYGGNKTVADFLVAKKLARQVYRGMEFTFYCGCAYQGRLVDHASCGYTPQSKDERAYRIEWEHVVPAYNFGRSFKEWRQGDPRCRNERGKSFKGRTCARVASKKFRRMEADLYNLVPEIGELNQRRSNFPMGLLPNVHAMFGQCRTKIAKRTIEPRPQIRGFIARTYQYMDSTYPGHGIISKKNRKLFDAWHKEFPPSQEEIERARRIAKIQGNHNPFVLLKESNR